MSNRVYPYYPSWDGKATQPVTAKLVELCGKRWGTKSLGTYVNRPMRNNAGLSVHATGYAADIQYKDEAQAREMWDWFLANSKALGLCELHWYAYGSYGAGYRCSRGEGKAGVKIYTATDNAGSYQGSPNWLHFEMAKQSAEAFEAAWRALPKP
jgi:hypothetical protein